MPLPETLGRLQRVGRLGEGGFATVWRYYDAELRSDVAVKALAENWAQRLDVRERFLEEARILRRADSDHIVRVYDVGEVDGTPYLVMTYADLGSLATLLVPGEPVAPRRVRALVEQAAAGLAVLHDHGVVHRDVKPQNLLLRSSTGGDRLLVADLGVAKAMLHASGITQVVGTPAYMAPEQATGEGLSVKADVHALAAVAYHLITARQVRTGSVHNLVDASLPPAPSTLVDVPEAVDEALLTALQPDPDDRWDDIHAFAAALRASIPDPDEDGGTATLWRAPVRRRPDPPPEDDRTPDDERTPEESEVGAPAQTRDSSLITALIVLLVFIATFGAAFGAAWYLTR